MFFFSLTRKAMNGSLGRGRLRFTSAAPLTAPKNPPTPEKKVRAATRGSPDGRFDGQALFGFPVQAPGRGIVGQEAELDQFTAPARADKGSRPWLRRPDQVQGSGFETIRQFVHSLRAIQRAEAQGEAGTAKVLE